MTMDPAYKRQISEGKIAGVSLPEIGPTGSEVFRMLELREESNDRLVSLNGVVLAGVVRGIHSYSIRVFCNDETEYTAWSPNGKDWLWDERAFRKRELL